MTGSSTKKVWLGVVQKGVTGSSTIKKVWLGVVQKGVTGSSTIKKAWLGGSSTVKKVWLRTLQFKSCDWEHYDNVKLLL